MRNHKLTIVAASVATMIALSSCSMAPPKVIYPDGSSTVPANSPARIAALQTARESSRAMLSENEALRAQMVAMQKQMEEIRSTAIAVLAQSANAQPLPQPPAPATWEQVPPTQYTKPVAPTKQESLQKPSPHSALDVMPVPRHVALSGRDASHAAYFVRTFATNKTGFTLDAAGRENLLSLAAQARAIEIQGATDSYVADAPNKRVAYLRAHNVRKVLVEAGIDAAKIKTRAFAAGYFAAPNDTADGRAQNRRVQIIFFRVDATHLEGA